MTEQRHPIPPVLARSSNSKSARLVSSLFASFLSPAQDSVRSRVSVQVAEDDEKPRRRPIPPPPSAGVFSADIPDYAPRRPRPPPPKRNSLEDGEFVMQ